ncbi:MAG TPA: class I SAM-dependent methyltransferase [Candidatus Angelobacter sp.]|nr:class I SAM-dependent methyltransferase [Candidatus Angelobacter sp.]
MKLFPHREFGYYSFALHAGLLNLFSNGMRLGVKKTIGKITQPINGYSRFPEYYWFETAIRNHQGAATASSRLKILDVGSPKMLGLYLASNTEAEIMLTDISATNVDEYQTMWQALQAKARGQASFSLQDARSLNFPDAEFDVVFSMSVIEHIEGEQGDSQAIHELLRVLKPGGLLALSVPFGAHYVEQKRIGFAGAARKTGDSETYFFQRIYDRGAFQKRILEQASDLNEITLTAVARRNQWLVRAFGSLGESARGAVGFVNPLLSVAINRSSNGVENSFKGSYGDLHSASDVYGDLILTGHKK